MKQNHLNTFYRFSVLIGVVVLLDSCKLFRKKEDNNVVVTRPKSVPPTNTSKTYNAKTINSLISTARSYTGVPYRAGGTDRNGMDCSGLLFCVNVLLSIINEYIFDLNAINTLTKFPWFHPSFYRLLFYLSLS